MTPEDRALDALLRRALPQPRPEAVARLQDGIAYRIARAPLPAPPGPLARLRALLPPVAPAGWGALAALATCALWLTVAAPQRPAEDPLAPLTALPVAGEFL